MSRNCRCCGNTYNKDGTTWSISITDDEPVGFCDWCDHNNRDWFMPNLKCHNPNTCKPEDCKEHQFSTVHTKRPICINCGTYDKEKDREMFPGLYEYQK